MANYTIHEGRILEELLHRFNVKKVHISKWLGQHNSFINKKIKADKLDYDLLIRIRKYFIDLYSYDIRENFDKLLEHIPENIINDNSEEYGDNISIVNRQKKEIEELRVQNHELTLRLNYAYQKLVENTFGEMIKTLQDEQQLMRTFIKALK